MREFVIDGSHFSTLEGFYNEIGEILIPGQWWGCNLDAFNDILSWSDEGLYSLIWKNATISRKHLGYEAMVKELVRQRSKSPFNSLWFEERLEVAGKQQGQTLFDKLVEIIYHNKRYVVLTLEE